MTNRPQPMPRWLRWRSNILQAPLLFLATGLFGTVALIASLFARTGRTQHRIARAWARACLLAAGGSVTVRGLENLPEPRTAVYASNHTSYMDIPVVFSSLPFQFRILAKKELWQWPFIGWYLNRSGQIPIDTDNPHATLSSLGAGVKALRAGMPLFVFPEGSRTPDGELKDFLSGAAFLAIRAQVPLVPIALTGIYHLLPMHTRHFYPCPMTIAIGPPIPTAGLTMRQADDLTARLRSAIAEMLAPPLPVPTPPSS
ncbi:MAG TPA: lysophospholipid acyltransferase family protein [Chloroflexota bacterium]|nr:lysophospholipid acyltransferase family protein [Chloroflexota bacterium]